MVEQIYLEVFTVSTLEIIKQRNHKQFSAALQRKELQTLQREHAHLLSKACQRELNQWEQERLEEIKAFFQAHTKNSTTINVSAQDVA